MKVKIIKPHHTYAGTVDVDDARAKYLVRMGIAEIEKGNKREHKETKTAKKKK